MKKIIFIFVILLWGCTKPELPYPQVATNDNIFSVKESGISNGQAIHFNLPKMGTYTLTLIDKETLQVISRERFIGQNGENVKKIYTKSIPIKYLYLLLEDDTKNQIGKTTIVIN